MSWCASNGLFTVAAGRGPADDEKMNYAEGDTSALRQRLQRTGGQRVDSYDHADRRVACGTSRRPALCFTSIWSAGRQWIGLVPTAIDNRIAHLVRAAK
jgi:hypothetical protein